MCRTKFFGQKYHKNETPSLSDSLPARGEREKEPQLYNATHTVLNATVQDSLSNLYQNTGTIFF
jgi:hypothetical protein